jgi:tRNA A-37 threonylcarbamoyl transferase component Bud32
MYTDGWSQLCFPAARWSVVPEWRQILFSDTGLRWQEWRDSGRLHLVKDAPHRKVFRVELSLQLLPQHTANPDFGLAGKKTVYVKLYPLTGFRRLAETLGVSNKAREECEKLLSLLRQGIPTLEPIACGSDQRHAFVVTVGLEDVVPLDRWLIEIFPNLTTCEQQRLTFVLPDVVARIIAALHRAGAYHADLHAGNLLITYQPGEEPKIYVTDAWEIRLSRVVSWYRSRRNLVLFGSWFLERTRAIDRRRFLRAYIRYRSDLQIPPARERQAARQLEKSLWRSLVRFYRRRERRAWSENRYFYRWFSPNSCNTSETEFRWRAWAVRELPTAALEQIADEAAMLLPGRRSSESAAPDNSTPASSGETAGQIQSGQEQISSGELQRHSVADALPCWHDRGRRGGFWQTTVCLGERPVAVVVKCFRLDSLRLRLAERYRLGPASRSWQYGHALWQRGIPTPRPLALLHGYRRFCPAWALLVCEKLEDVVDLRQAIAYLQKEIPRDGPDRYWQLIRAVAKLVARLHRHGFSDRDLKAAHFLVPRCYLEEGGDEPELHLVDLVGLSRPLVLTQTRRMRDLARLQASFHNEPAISRTDRLRFLLAYLRDGLPKKCDWKHWWRKIAAAAQRKVLRNQRQNRPLT